MANKGLMRTLRFCAVCSLSLTILGSAMAAEGARFPVRSYVIEGGTLFSKEALDKVLAPYTGDAVDFKTIQAAVSALEAHYSNTGYGAVKVVLPEQDIDDSKVRLRVVEARIANISVT